MCTSAFIGCQRLASIEAVLGTRVFFHMRASTPSPKTKPDTKYTIVIEERRERRGTVLTFGLRVGQRKALMACRDGCLIWPR